MSEDIRLNQVQEKEPSYKLWDQTNFDGTPWFMNANLSEALIDPITNSPMTAEYIWNTSGQEREELIKRTFEIFRSQSFNDVIPKMTNEELNKTFKSLKKINPSECTVLNPETNELFCKNTNSTGTDILKHFSGELFYSAKGEKGTNSCKEVFENDDKLNLVLKNRMGYRTTKEDGTIRPYVFSMSNKMLFQGMRSSGLAYQTSTFKPVIAKYFYEKYSTKRVFDYSSGWGARALGAISLGREYYGVDPYTHKEVNDLIRHFGGAGEVFNSGSEEKEVYEKINNLSLKNSFDFVFSSPPYFTLETYDTDGENQSVNKFSDYKDWISGYWAATIKNIKENIISKDGHFGLVMVEKYKKLELAKDMIEVLENNGFELIETIPFITSKSHLSGKAKSKVVSKNTEKVFVFKVKG